MRLSVAVVATVSVALFAAGCGASGEDRPSGMEPVAASSSERSGDSGRRVAGSGDNADKSGSTAEPSAAASSMPSGGGTRDPAGAATGTERAPESSPENTDTHAGPGKDGQGDADGKNENDELKPLEYGSEGPRVRALQRSLRSLHYDPGTVDGVFGGTTRYALWAFQKVNGLDADGVVGPRTRKALEDPRRPDPLAPGGSRDRVEIDLDRQLLYVYEGGRLALISHISSGSEDPYCTADGHCGDAVTPAGDFAAIWRVNGWRESNLGRLYNPVYFASGGFAVHGSQSVPLYPASHGCVRIPMHTAAVFPDLVQDGEAFYVRG